MVTGKPSKRGHVIEKKAGDEWKINTKKDTLLKNTDNDRKNKAKKKEGPFLKKKTVTKKHKH